MVRLYHTEKRTTIEIGAEYGVTCERVRQILKGAGRPPSGKNRGAVRLAQIEQRLARETAKRSRYEARIERTRSRSAEMLKCHNGGMSWSKIAAAFGVSLMAAYRTTVEYFPEARRRAPKSRGRHIISAALSPTLSTALDNALIAGRTLELLIGADHPPADATTADALAHYGAGSPAFPAWLAWSRLELLRVVVDGERVPVETKHERDVR